MDGVTASRARRIQMLLAAIGIVVIHLFLRLFGRTVRSRRPLPRDPDAPPSLPDAAGDGRHDQRRLVTRRSYDGLASSRR
jgi:hypothetical protein